jgi:hypothetical protein
MATVKLIAPVGYSGSINGGVTATQYTIASDRSVSVDSRDAIALASLGFQYYAISVAKIFISSPLPADLISTVAAVAVANGALTIAAQPPHARKLQYRLVYTSGTLTTATLTVVGFDQDGNAITEVSNFAAIAASQTTTSAYAWSKITSATVSNVTGTFSVTIGIGPSNDFGLPTFQVAGLPVDITVNKATKITKVLGTSNTAADDVASTGTLDTVARTFAPTTAPAASGLVDYEFTYSFGGN